MRSDLNRRKSLGRRQFLTGAAGGLLGSVALPRRGTALPPSDIVPLHDRLSPVTSGGTNILALSIPGGLVVADSGAPERSERVMDTLRQLAPAGRVRTVLNTHWHLENTGANGLLRQAGAAIVAHDNTRLWMATPTWMPADDRYRPPRPETAHPTETFYVDGSIGSGNERVDYGYLIEAHTYLLDHGARADVVDDMGRKPIDLVRGIAAGPSEDRSKEIITLLER